MDKNDLFVRIEQSQEILADKHDGSYELTREAVKSYENVPIETINYLDLNVIYLMTVGTWKHGFDRKKETVMKSNLPVNKIQHLCDIIDIVKQKAQEGEYAPQEKAGMVGMFGTGFFSFMKLTNDESAQNFISMCIDILNINDDNKMFDRAEKVLTKNFRGMKAAAASMVLHCLKPYTFPILNGNMGLENVFKILGAKLKRIGDIDTYIENCRNIKTFRDSKFSVKNYRIFDLAATWEDNDEIDPWQDSIGITKEQWLKMLDDETIFSKENIKFFEYVISIDGKDTYNNLVSKFPNCTDDITNLSKRIAEHTECVIPNHEGAKEFENYWNVPFTSYLDDNKDDLWDIRVELQEALKVITNDGKENINMNKNIILYGPPGTGKTYNSINYAVAIIENKPLVEVQAESHYNVLKRYNEYKEQRLIEFTTFHQSYGYEEFVEGIKPEMRGSEECTDITYHIENGIFKDFCEASEIASIVNDSPLGLNDIPTIWKVSLYGTGDNDIRKECLENGHIRIGWDDYGKTITDNMDYPNGGSKVLNAFVNSMQVGDIVISCYSEQVTDAIGVITGEYEWVDSYSEFKRVRKVNWFAKNIRENIYKINNQTKMTLSSVYRLKNIAISDVLNLIGKKTNNSNSKNRVFIIDEINRGNISKILGELITLIEPSKRIGKPEEIKVRLPYSKNLFGVPDNIYLLGTMNTADRSIALIDTALRRRFDFVEMHPDLSVLEDVFVEDVSIANMLEKLNKRIEVLCDREHTIGHAYFIPLKDKPTIERLSGIFRNCVIPLLQEYFYEDYEKIRLVLGDNNKPELQQFIISTENDYNELFGNVEYNFDVNNTYTINQEAFENIDSYMI